MTEAPDPTPARRDAILEAAARVFLRYGFKKTSMDDLARAAGLSRQGLYLHFSTKEALFKEAVAKLVRDLQTAFRTALAREDLSVEAKLVEAFDAVHGHAMGELREEHMNELLEAAKALVGPALEDLDKGVIADVTRLLQRSGVAARWKAGGISAKALAENLFSTSEGVKHRVATRAEYRDHLRVAARIVCSALDG